MKRFLRDNRWIVIGYILALSPMFFNFVTGLEFVLNLSDEVYFIGSILFYILIVISSFIVIRKLGKEQSFQFKSIKWQYIFLLPIFLYVKYHWGMFVLENFPMPQNQQTINAVVPNFTQLSQFLFYVVACLSGPIFEEVTFRGMMMSILPKKIRRYYLDIVITAVFFSLYHVHFPNFIWTDTISYFGSGILYGIFYRLTDSIYFPITFHILWNILTVFRLI